MNLRITHRSSAHTTKSPGNHPYRKGPDRPSFSPTPEQVLCVRQILPIGDFPTVTMGRKAYERAS